MYVGLLPAAVTVQVHMTVSRVVASRQVAAFNL